MNSEQELMAKHQKRKDRIKNIMILFLVVMLLLTFFSNTIMNYSLAEVGTAYASSGSLTTKIRGDGFVEAKDPIQVKTDKASEVLKVYVKDGDKVKKGQTMFVLEGASVSDLKQAQSDLLTLNYDYQKALLEMEVPDYGKNNLEIKYARDDLEKALQDIEDTKEDIKKKKEEYKKLKEKMNAAKKKMEKKSDAVADKASEISEIDMKLEGYTTEKEDLTGETNEDIRAKEEAVTAAKRVTEDAQTAYDEAKEAENEYAGSDSESTLAEAIKTQKKAVTALERELETLKEELAAAQNQTVETAEIRELRKAVRSASSEISNRNLEITQITAEINDATANMNAAKDEVEKKKYQDILTELQERLTEARKSLSSAQQDYYNAQADLDAALMTTSEQNDAAVKTAKQKVSDKEAEIAEANQELAELQSEKLSADAKAEMLAAAKKKTAECQTALKTATTAQKAAERALEDAQAALKKANAGDVEALEKKIKEAKAKKIKLENQKTKLDTSYTEVQAAYETAKAAVEPFQKEDETALDTVNQAAEEKRKALETLYLDLAATQEDDDLKQKLSSLDSDQKKKLIEQKRKEIAKLKKKKKPMKIKATQAGIVGSVSIKVGDTTTPDVSFAEIQIKKNGFKLSIPVTLEQSKMVKRGDHASVLNVWDDDIKAVLSEIKTDAQNPNAGRTLVFDVSGNVENGTSLSIAVGERTANYDLIVPTSAIRTDSDGKFVLIIEEKSSPVGNRYIARKEAVTVVTQDETQSAITGGFDSYTNIITTSSKAVEPGDYVRLAS